jgi:RNA polymerase sigma-70 factor (ECF subfamily)
MDALPARTRGLIEQVKLQGASIAEAAGTAGMTETAAKVAIHRGLQAMARFLSRRGPTAA